MNTLHNVLGIRAIKKDIIFITDVSSKYSNITAQSICSNKENTQIKFIKARLVRISQSSYSLIQDKVKILKNAHSVLLETENKHIIKPTQYNLIDGDVVFLLKPTYTDIYATFIIDVVVSKSIPLKISHHIISKSFISKNIHSINNATPIHRHQGKMSISNNLTIGSSFINDNTLYVNGTFNLNDTIYSNDKTNLFIDSSFTTVKSLNVISDASFLSNINLDKNLYVKENVTVDGDVFIKGNITYSGDSYTINSETLLIKDNYIILNDGISSTNDPLESGLIIQRAKINNEYAEPFKIIYNDNRENVDEYLEVGISGQLMRVATTNAMQSDNSGSFPIWDKKGYFNVNTGVSISGDIFYVKRDVQINGTIYNSDGTPYSTGGGEASKGDGISKLDSDPTEKTNGDLYFNTTTNTFRLYNNSWLNTEIGQILEQPPPIMNLRIVKNPAFFDIKWDNPPQYASSLTSDIIYSSEHSSAVRQHPITGKNIVYFPIVNRICVKLYSYENNVKGAYISYPLYTSTNESVASSISQVDESGNVVYRKGDIVSGQPNSLRTSYTSIVSNHYLSNMPNTIRFYKVVPTVLPDSLPNIILPFTGYNPLFNLSGNKYLIEIWLENNSLQSVNKKIIIGEYQESNPPSSPSFIDAYFYDNETNNYPRIKIDIKDPSFIDGESSDQNENINLDQIIFEWSVDNTNWKKLTRVFSINSNSYINLTNGIQSGINRIINTSILRSYYFDININDMGNDYTTEILKLHTQAISNLYVSVRYKNVSNQFFTTLSTDNTRNILFDVPSIPNSVNVSFINSTSYTDMSCSIIVKDPDFVLGNTNPTLQFDAIRFEWGISAEEIVWKRFNKINTTLLDPSGILFITPRERIITDTVYTFNTTYLDEWSSLDGSAIVVFRVSYRNKSKPIFGESKQDKLLFEAPSTPQKNILSFSLTTDLRESRCNIQVQNPENILATQPDYNLIARYTGIQFQWGISNEEIVWNNFVQIIDGNNKVLVNGLYVIEPVTEVNKSYQFDISSTYLGENTVNNDLSKNLLVRIRFRNNVIYGANDDAFSPWLNSNELYFDRPSKPRKNEIDYLTTLSNGLTRVNQIVIDPSFVLGENDTTNHMNFTGIKFFWKSDHMEEWKPFTRIRDTRKNPDVIQLNDGEYTINNVFSNNPFTYTFDICSTYLGEDATTLIDDGSKNMSVYIQYRNSAISAYSDLLESNVILLEPPAQPPLVDLSFNQTYGNFSAPITECILHITDPNVMRTQHQYDDDISFTGLHFQWKKWDNDDGTITEGVWTDFSGINYHATDLPTEANRLSIKDGVHSIIRKKLSTTRYTFAMTKDYLGNSFDGMNTDDTLEVQVQYRNSVLTEFSEYKNSNQLIFERPSIPLLIDLSFNDSQTTSLTDISNTRYRITLTKPENILETDTLTNLKINFTGIEFQWGISGENTQWNNFINIATTPATLSNRISSKNGVYQTNAKYVDVSNVFYFDTTTAYLDASVNQILTDTSKNIVLRARYRNSTVPEFSDYLNSNVVFINRPSKAQELTTQFFKSYTSRPLTEAILNIKRPQYTISGDTVIPNDRINLTGVRFEWKHKEQEQWNNFQKIKLKTNIINTNDVKTLTDGIYTIREKNTPVDISYIFDISAEYLGPYTISDASSIDIRVSYRNTTIGQTLTDGYNEPILIDLSFNTPSAPQLVELSFNSTIGTELVPITVCQIKVKDPQFSLKTLHNLNVFMRDISFQWKLDDRENWNNFKQMKLGNDISNIPYLINRAIDEAERTYTFELSGNYMDNFEQPRDGSNLYVRASYRNTILPLINGPTTTSNALLFERPSVPRNVDISFISSLDTGLSFTRYSVILTPPLNVLNTNNLTNNKIHFTGIEFKWGISAESIVWKDFSNISINVGVASNRIRENSIFSTNSSYTDTSTNFNFVSSTIYFKEEDLNEIVSDSDKHLLVKVRYRNSVVPDWSDDLSSNAILLNRPTAPKSITAAFNNTTTSGTTTTTTCRLDIKKPALTVSGDIYLNTNNVRLDLRRIHFQWGISAEQVEWKNFTGIKTTFNGTITSLSDGIYIIPKGHKNTPEDISYCFDLSTNYLGSDINTLIGDNSKNLIVRAAYANTVINGFSAFTETPPLYFDHPTAPAEVTLSFNNNTTQDVKNSLTRCKIVVKDPAYLLREDKNPAIFFTGILFKWSQNNKDWYNFNKINDGGLKSLSNGVYSIQRTRDVTQRNFFFDISNEYIPDFTPSKTENTTLYVKAQYRNSIVSSWSDDTSSNIVFGIPDIPSIVDVSMTDFSELTVYLGGINNQSVINGFDISYGTTDVSTNTPFTNTPYAAYIKQVELFTEYQLFTNEETINTSFTVFDYSGNTDPSGITAYKFYPVNDICANNIYKFRFKARVKNNLVDEWSQYNDIGEYDTTDTLKNHLYITTPLTEEQTIKALTMFSGNTQSLLNMSWDYPGIRKRGVTKTTNKDVPHIEKVDIYAYRKDIVENRITLKNTYNGFYNKITRVGTDPTSFVNNLTYKYDISSILLKDGDTTKEFGDVSLNNERVIKLEIQQKNMFVKEMSTISGEFSYKLNKPSGYTVDISSVLSNTTGDINRLDVSWLNPAGNQRGFQVKALNSTTFQDISNAIYKYEVEISANRIDSKSPYYRSLTQYGNTPKINFTISAPNDYTDASRNIVGNTTAITRTTTTNTSNVLVYPETEYNISVRGQNRFYIWGDYLFNKTTSNAPLEALEYSRFTNINNLLPISTTVNLANQSKYALKGFVLNQSNINTSTIGTIVDVIKPSTLIINSPSKTHTMNRYKLNTWIDAGDLANTITDMSYVKMRQFQIVNRTDNNAMVYQLGSKDNQYDISNVGPTRNMVRITSGNRADQYNTSYDAFNQGYWWKEDISYQINFNNKTDDLYGKPIQLDLLCKYNSSANNEIYPSFDFTSNTLDVSRNILTDTSNNGPAYFDDLSSNPTFTRMTVDISENNHTNKINGIPNLYPLGTINSVNYTVGYKVYHYLNNYSKYFGLSGEICYYEIFTGTKLRSISWANKPNEMTRLERQWEISGVEIDVNAATNLTTPQTGLKLFVRYRNQLSATYNTDASFTRLMLYDKASVTHLETLMNSDNATNSSSDLQTPTGSGTIIKVPNNFNPFNPIGATQTTDLQEAVFSDFITYNPRQLILYNGQFCSIENMKSKLDLTNSTIKTNYGLVGDFKTSNIGDVIKIGDVDVNDNYSYVIFKYVRDLTNSNNAENQIPVKFIISFNINTDITYADLENNNVCVFVQVKQNTRTTLYTGNVEDNDPQPSYKWVLYKPSKNYNSGSVQTEEIDLKILEGLGSNGDTTDTFTNGNSSQTGLYGNTVRNLSGVFYVKHNMNSSNPLTFYIAIGIKNNISRFLTQIHSFDVYSTTGAILRPTS